MSSVCRSSVPLAHILMCTPALSISMATDLNCIHSVSAHTPTVSIAANVHKFMSLGHGHGQDASLRPFSSNRVSMKICRAASCPLLSLLLLLVYFFGPTIPTYLFNLFSCFLPYSRKIWQVIKLGDLAVYLCNLQIKICQYFILAYIHMAIPYRTTKFNIFAMAIWRSRFNSR